jgi:hypothetical protein
MAELIQEKVYLTNYHSILQFIKDMELVVLIIDINRISHIVAAPPPLFHITVE